MSNNGIKLSNMKKNLFIIILLLISAFAVSAQTSNQQQDQGERLARKIAKQIKDSLNLTGAQMNQLATINISLHQQKKQLMSSGQSRDSIGKGLQRIENTRDSLYRLIIPIEKFELYKLKKRNLINNNRQG